eukprot:Seg19621.2 transcript_id=Seg19621.2/GoldUCD/mRNA.D3Y31 product="hypothetical protein" protein_id=Seg19621.2/GoldUCD/D3Y31
MLKITPVVEVPLEREDYQWPWRISSEYGSYIPIEIGCDISMGTFFSTLLYGGDPTSVDDLITELREEDEFAVYGGFQISDGSVTIGPSCCCGLENWREWRELLNDGVSPWLGHDPTAWAELDEGYVVVWPDEGRAGACVRVSKSEYSEKLAVAEEQLCGFLKKLNEWKPFENKPEVPLLLEKLRRNFGVE